jgi:hypothetical protein
MWGISGDVGQDVNDVLLKQIALQYADQLQRQKLKESQHAMDMDRQKAALAEQEFKAQEQERARRVEMEGIERREASNQKGVRRMASDFILQRNGNLGPEDKRGLAALQIEADGTFDPRLLQEPEVKRHPLTVKGPNGQPMRRLVDENELMAGVEEYQEPKEPRQGPHGQMQWVIGPDGKKAYRIPREGDSPYDEVAARQAPKQEKSAYSLDQSRDVVRKVSDILPRISGWTAGPGGAFLSNIPGTEASDVGADLQSLAANLAFDQLQRMRDASKTGGALGNVANQELDLLKNVEASIKQDQSPANLKKNLRTIGESAARYLAEAEKLGGLDPMRPMSSRDGAPQAGKRFTIVGVK